MTCCSGCNKALQEQIDDHCGRIKTIEETWEPERYRTLVERIKAFDDSIKHLKADLSNRILHIDAVLKDLERECCEVNNRLSSHINASGSVEEVRRKIDRLQTQIDGLIISRDHQLAQNRQLLDTINAVRSNVKETKHPDRNCVSCGRKDEIRSWKRLDAPIGFYIICLDCYERLTYRDFEGP